MAETGTVLIAVTDTVLADSLRFSLELEGYAARLCAPPFPDGGAGPRTCLLLDEEVFAGLIGKGGEEGLRPLAVPTVLMVNQRTPRLMDSAKAAGIATILDKPLLGGVLFETIRNVLEAESTFGED